MAIDQNQRRYKIEQVTIDLVACEGLAAATMRRIAAEAGASTTAITHYFDDKDELLLSAFSNLSVEGERRFNEVLEADPSDMIGALLTMVPWCSANVRRWNAFLAFWDEGARNAELAELLARSAHVGTNLLRKLLSGRIADGAALENAAALLSAIIQGMALNILVDRQNWPERRIHDMLEQAVNLTLLQAGIAPVC